MDKKEMITLALALLALFFPSLGAAGNKVRVHCQPTGYVFEYISENTDVEALPVLPNEQIVIVDESEIPPYKYPEQLSCRDGKLVFDPNYKPPYALKTEAKQEQIKQAKAALDEELGKAEPDVITALRLQRAIEKLKEGR